MLPLEIWWSIGVCVVLALGVTVHRLVRLHVAMMLSAFAADLALVLYLEIGRGAVERAVAGVSFLRYFHISMAVASIVLYGVMIWSGWRLWNTGAGRDFHKRMALIFGLCRGTVLVTSFMIPSA